MIPEEISYPIEVETPHSSIIVNYDIYKENLEKQRITKYDETMSHNGKLYYKNPEAYYGPETTYASIPEIKDLKFETNVIIGNLDDIGIDNEKIRNELVEMQNELSNVMLFSNEPKYISDYHVKDNYALPYYDTTHEDKVIRIRELKYKIIELRRRLNITNEEVGFYVEVLNTTFPMHSDDILNHFNQTYYHVNQNINASNYDKVNVTYSDLNLDLIDLNRTMMNNMNNNTLSNHHVEQTVDNLNTSTNINTSKQVSESANNQ